jgi:(S)-3,5-dihydroxyphenylglycine transaminase
VAAAEDLLVLEDDPYGLFGLDDAARPAMKALDRDRRVVYLGSFAKSCFPGARVGFLVADQTVRDGDRRRLLAEELATVKSMLTVNTSAIAQAVIGGMLVECGFSLRAANQEKIRFYRRNLRTLLAALEAHFPAPRKDHPTRSLASLTTPRGPRVGWNVPGGGFFAVLDVPGLRADEDLLEVSAREYGVLWTPMSFFYTHGGGAHAIRLSCSWLEPAQIEEGVARLARLIKDQG